MAVNKDEVVTDLKDLRGSVDGLHSQFNFLVRRIQTILEVRKVRETATPTYIFIWQSTIATSTRSSLRDHGSTITRSTVAICIRSTSGPMADSRKVVFSSLYLKGKAETWYQTEALRFEKMTWPEF